MTRPFAASIDIRSTPMEPWPLPPELIVSGNPETRGAVLSQSADGRIVRGIWSCTPGSFRWDCSYDETLVVVEGRATVTLPDGSAVELAPGDLAFFERGQTVTWTVHETFRKGFHADSPEPLPF